MTAAQLLQGLTYALYLSLFTLVLLQAIRSPHRRNVDIALFFGAITSVLVIVTLRAFFDATGPLASALILVGLAVLMTVPYLFLRLARDFRGVPSASLRAAELGLVASIAALAFMPGAGLPPSILLLIAVYLASTLGYCSAAFVREARVARGVTRRRMQAVALGSGFLGIALVLAGAAGVWPAGAEALRAVGELAQLGSALAFFAGFSPPPSLRRHWQEAEVHRFLTSVSRLAGTADFAEVVRQIEARTASTFGASHAWLSLFDDLRRELRVTANGRTTIVPIEGTLVGRVLREQRPRFAHDLPTEYPQQEAEAGPDPLTVALAAPVSSGGRRIGVLAVGSSTGIFAEEDLALLELLAGQAGVVLDNARLLDEVRSLTDEERRRAHEMTNRLAAIVESSADAIIGKTLDGAITSWNLAAERLYGYRAGEAIGRPISFIAPPDRIEEIKTLMERLRRGERIIDFETERVRKDGALVNVALSLSPIRDADGTIVGAATIARDVSGRIEAARQRDELETRLRQSERLESIGRLAGGIAHDFNNILTVIVSYADFAISSLDDAHPARAEVAQIVKAADRATAFVRQLLAFARREPMHTEVLSIGPLIEDLRDMIRRSLRESIEIRTQIPGNLWPVRADGTHMEQVLLNLAVNAGDAMPRGGLLLIEARNVQLDEAAVYQHRDLAAGPYVGLTVTDTGTGMTRDVLEHAFEPFFTTKLPGAGTGLGLATVYGIVTQAGGSASLYSEPGRGTSVRVLLPAVPPGVSADEPLPHGTLGSAPPVPAHSLAPHPGWATILVVEDEEPVREAARRILTGAGYRVLDADGPRTALKLAAAHDEIDVLLTDMVMPDMSGPLLAKRLEAERPGLQVIYMSGYSEELVRALERLDGPLVQKPFTRASLLAIVGGALATADRPA